MSRTYRKKKRKVPEWAISERYHNGQYIKIKDPKERKKAIKKYYSDKPSGYNGPTKEYRQRINRQDRRRLKNIKNPDTRRSRRAQWDWW